MASSACNTGSDATAGGGAACLTQGWPSWTSDAAAAARGGRFCRRAWVPQASLSAGLRLHTQLSAAPEMPGRAALATRALSGGLRTAFRRVWGRLRGWEWLESDRTSGNTLA